MSILKDDDIKYFASSSYLGGPVTETLVPLGVLNNVFKAVEPDEALDGATHYACFYVKNTHDTETMFECEATITNPSATLDAVVAWGVGRNGVGGQEQIISDPTKEPADIIWYTSVGELVRIGNLPARGHIGIWVRRIVLPDSEADKVEGFSLTFQGKTNL